MWVTRPWRHHSFGAGRGDSIDDADALRAGYTAAVLGHVVLAPSILDVLLRSFSWACWSARRGGRRPADAGLGRGGGPGRGAAVHHRCRLLHPRDLRLGQEGGTHFTDNHVGATTLFMQRRDRIRRHRRGADAHSGSGAASLRRDVWSGAHSGCQWADRAPGRLGLLQPDSRRRLPPGQRVLLHHGRLPQRRCENGHRRHRRVRLGRHRLLPRCADVAETTYTPFGAKGRPCRLIVRRVRPTPGSQLALFVEFTYQAFITDREGEMVEAQADHRRHAESTSSVTLKTVSVSTILPSVYFEQRGVVGLFLNVIADNLAASPGSDSRRQPDHHRDPSPPLPEPPGTTRLSPNASPCTCRHVGPGRSDSSLRSPVTATSCS